MRIVKSDYRKDIVFVGFDGEVSDEEIIKMLRHDFGWEDGSDFDGIRREEMDATHTNTDFD